jgi:hypothetical protein
LVDKVKEEEDESFELTEDKKGLNTVGVRLA